MAIVLGMVALGVVLVGVVLAIFFAGKQADAEAAPQSEPGDFAAPVSSGGYAFRRTDETQEEFRTRIAEPPSRPPPTG